MREGRYDTISYSLFGLAVFSIAVVLMLPGTSLSQGGGGRSASTNRTAAKSKPIKRKLSIHRVARPVRVRPTVVRSKTPVNTGSLAVFVSERASQVTLSRIDGIPGLVSTFASPVTAPLALRMLPAASYKLTVKKPGFYDAERVVIVTAGRRKKVLVSLRPKMSYLTVNSNVADAEIEIENLGKFNRPLRKYPVKPGLYRISVKRKGFKPQTAMADLRTAGSERNISLVLDPVPIDTVLGQSYQRIQSGDHAAAAELANQVLRQNPAHAKANLLYGLAGFYRGDVSSADYFLRAVRNGETVKLPVKLLDTSSGPRLVDAEMSLDRDHISFKTAGPVDLNVTISKQDISDLRLGVDPGSLNGIVLGGKGDVFGRRIEQTLMLYSDRSSLRSDRKEVLCETSAGQRSCRRDIDAIYDLLSNWSGTKK